MDIVDYKQTVLNYGLGMIMDLVSRKCREEGDMLRFIWENTFAIFEDAFSMMASAAVEHEKSRLNEAAELQSIFNCNNNYLKEANAQIKQENTQIFEKMKKVILWNKRLRRERKKQDLDIRILEYRNITYAQVLEETV